MTFSCVMVSSEVCCFGNMEAHLVSWEMLRVKQFHTALPRVEEQTLAIRYGQQRAAEGCRARSSFSKRNFPLGGPLNHQEMPLDQGGESDELTGEKLIGNQE